MNAFRGGTEVLNKNLAAIYNKTPRAHDHTRDGNGRYLMAALHLIFRRDHAIIL